MRFSAVVPILLSIAAFILALLVMIAGKSTSFMQDVYVIQVNTTNIATNIDLNTVLQDAGISSSGVIGTGISALDSALSGLDNDALGKLLNSAAHELGLHDLYTAHVLTWCEGTVTENNQTGANQTTTTACTKPKIPFSFDPVTIIENELTQNITLQDLGFPTDDVDKIVNALEEAYRAMSVLYLVGVILSGLTILCGIGGFLSSRLIEFGNSFAAFLAFIVLGVASAIGTAIAVKVRDIFNQKAAPINVTATSSTKYLGMTWAAVAIMFVVSMYWCFTCCCGRHNRRGNRYGDEKPIVATEVPQRRGWRSRF